jgi:hypothetical protein
MIDARDLLRVPLHEHVASVEDKPVEWGADDCTMWAAGWFRRVKGRALDLEPYGSRDEALALIEGAGDLATLWTAALDGHLAEQYGEPEFGDVGVIASRMFGQVGGIFGDDGVFFWRAERGTALLRPRTSTIVKIWTITC